MMRGVMQEDGKILYDGPGNARSGSVINFANRDVNSRYSFAEDVEPGDRVVATKVGDIWEVKRDAPKAPKPRHKRRSPKK